MLPPSRTRRISNFPLGHSDKYWEAYDEVVEAGEQSGNRMAVEIAHFINDKLRDALTDLKKYRVRADVAVNRLQYIRYFCHWRSDALDPLLYLVEYPDQSPSSTAAEMATNIGVHLMQELAELARTKVISPTSCMDFSVKLTTLCAAAFSMKALDITEKGIRGYQQSLNRKLGKNEAEALKIVSQLALKELSERPDQYYWRSRKKKGQLKVLHLAGSVAMLYNQNLEPRKKCERVSPSLVKVYLRKLIAEGKIG